MYPNSDSGNSNSRPWGCLEMRSTELCDYRRHHQGILNAMEASARLFEFDTLRGFAGNFESDWPRTTKTLESLWPQESCPEGQIALPLSTVRYMDSAW